MLQLGGKGAGAGGGGALAGAAARLLLQTYVLAAVPVTLWAAWFAGLAASAAAGG
jgi:hypothetical protein